MATSEVDGRSPRRKTSRLREVPTEKGEVAMSTPDSVVVEERDELHYLLLGLAGKLPDGLVAQARAWVADGRIDEAARAVAFTVVSQRVPLVEDDVALLEELLEDAGADPSILSAVEIAEYDPAPAFGFGATRPGAPTPG